MPRLRSTGPRPRNLRWRDPRKRQLYATQLAHGLDLFGEAWGRTVTLHNAPADVLADAKECWLAFRAEVEREHCELHGDDARFTRPVAWWLFEAPQPVDWRTPEPIRLWRLGELNTDDVREAMRRSPGGYDFAVRIARRYTTLEEQLELGIAEGVAR